MDKAATPAARLGKRMKSHFAYLAIQALMLLPQAGLRNAAQFGQSVEFRLWLDRNFPDQGKYFPTREALWNHLLSEISPVTELIVFEFGVAYGYTTSWWLKRSPSIIQWNGYDTFTGLPQNWQHFAKGAFDAGGQPPNIGDARVQWIIGRVEETFSFEKHQLFRNAQENTKSRCIYFFDLDLYNPTKHVMDIILPQLKVGDILYFDEAVDLDERRVLVESLEILQSTTRLIGSTPVALALWKNQ